MVRAVFGHKGTNDPALTRRLWNYGFVSDAVRSIVRTVEVRTLRIVRTMYAEGLKSG